MASSNTLPVFQIVFFVITLSWTPTTGQPNSFLTIQEAINVIPEFNNDWYIIHIGPGVFREKVVIKYNQPFIVMKGIGRNTTEIVSDSHKDTEDATFSTNAHNLVVKHLSIRNSYNQTQKPAVAAYLKGDYMYLEDVGFYSYQDTLWDVSGRHYFNNCFIEGAIDFIFGDGTSIYEKTVISVIGGGYITAQGRESPLSPSGFMFINCSVVGTAPTLLGRAWRDFARTVFSWCYFSEAVKPEGWYQWDVPQEYQLTYAEHECFGPGSKTDGRVKWEHHLTPEEVQQFTSMKFINASTWLGTDPYQKY